MRVFMSYSYDGPEYELKVRQLCDRLNQEDGIEMVFDQYGWAGKRKGKFMAKLKEADKVIMMCSKNYVDKVKDGKGGVAYEESIISAEVAEDIESEKFIPVLVDISPEELPASVSDVIAIDFRRGWTEDKYSELLASLRNEQFFTESSNDTDFTANVNEKVMQPNIKPSEIALFKREAETFAENRFLQIQTNNGVIPLHKSDNALVLHLIPLIDFGTERTHDVEFLDNKSSEVQVFDNHRAIGRINLDGILWCWEDSVCSCYTQVFKNGAIESVSDDFKVRENFLPSKGIIDLLDKIISSHMKFLQSINASTPILSKVSFWGMKDVKLLLRPPSDPMGPFLSDVLDIPSTLVSNYQQKHIYHEMLQVQMNSLWNAFGLPKCEFFYETGGNIKYKAS